MNAMKILIAYRDNHLFSIYMPQIISFLEELGHEVTSWITPVGEDVDKKAEDWLDTHSKASVLILDETFLWGNFSPGYEGPRCKRIRKMEGCKSILLDDLLRNTVVPAFFGEDRHLLEDRLNYARATEEGSRDAFQKMVCEVAKIIGTPALVSVNPGRLNDHAPFQNVQETAAAEHVTSWIREVFPDCEVSTHEERFQRPNPGSCKSCSTWVIHDRHESRSFLLTLDSGMGNPYLEFCLPVETTIENLGELGLLIPVREKVWPRIAEYLTQQIKSV